MKCEICGKECKGHSLGNHINNKNDEEHDISLKEYYDKYLKKEGEDICGACGNPNKFVSLTNGYTQSCSMACINLNPSTIRKRKETLMKNYGVDNASKSSVIQQRKISTYRERYGVDHHYQTKNIRDKYKHTCLEKYGVENVSQLDEVKDKKVNTLMKNYGVDHPMLIPGMMEQVNKKKRKTCLEKYGVENISQTLECREIFRNNMIDYLEECKTNGEPLSPYIGKNEPSFFKWLQLYTDYLIIRPDRMFGFFPDGYIKELSLVIEFDEPWHKHDKHKTHDHIKDQTYTKHNLNIFRVPQLEWEENPEIIKNRFLSLIESIEL